MSAAWGPLRGDTVSPLGIACAWLALSFYRAVMRGQGLSLWVLGAALAMLACFWMWARVWSR